MADVNNKFALTWDRLPDGRNVGAAVQHALGLTDEHRVKAIEIRFYPGEVITAKVVLQLSPANAADVVKVLEQIDKPVVIDQRVDPTHGDLL